MRTTPEHTTIIPPSGLAETSGWLPIATAPMDGTEVILFYPHMANGLVTAGHFHIGRPGCESYWYADLVNSGASPPTHWMHLPSPPQRGHKTTVAEATKIIETTRRFERR